MVEVYTQPCVYFDSFIMMFIINNSVYIALFLGIIFGFFVLFVLYKTKSKQEILLLSVFFSSLSFFSVSLFAIFESIIASQSIHYGAISSFGIYFVCPLLISLLFKSLNKNEVFDMYAIYVCPSMVFQRFHCLVSGCCSGIQFFHTAYCWPTRESEIFFYLFMLFYFYREKKKEQIKDGIMFPILMICYGLFRFINEFFRIGEGVFHLAHIWSVLCLISGYSFFTEIKKRRVQ